MTGAERVAKFRLSGDAEKCAEEDLRGQHERKPLTVEWRDRLARGH
jgi:hypothetical protein